jgi:phosphopantetheinyl transferase
VENAILLHARLSPGPGAGWAERLLQALPYARRLRLESADPAARRASLGGLALALTGARRCGRPARVRELVLETEAKPRLRDGPAFSIAHTADRVGCVVSATTEVGLDFERLPADVEASARLELLAWTATEATLKAQGRGLRHLGAVELDLDRATAALDGHALRLHEVRLGSHTVGHVAAGVPLELAVIELALDADEISAAVEGALGLPA